MSEQTKHTPGEWKAHVEVDPKTGGVWVGPPNDHENVICDIVGRKGAAAWTEEDHANAYLIAAAPDLLAACKAWLKHYDEFVRDKQIGDEPGIAEMRAAVAKAEGH